jgi:hypothetical protein
MMRAVLAAVPLPTLLHRLLELVKLIGSHNRFEPLAGLLPDLADLGPGLVVNLHQLLSSVAEDLFDLGLLVFTQVKAIQGLFQVVLSAPRRRWVICSVQIQSKGARDKTQGENKQYASSNLPLVSVANFHI